MQEKFKFTIFLTFQFNFITQITIFFWPLGTRECRDGKMQGYEKVGIWKCRDEDTGIRKAGIKTKV